MLPSIPNYPAHKKDYACTKNDVGLCEIQEERREQQDALAVCPDDLTSFLDLTDKDRKLALIKKNE
jgi:hypothetical protein